MSNYKGKAPLRILLILFIICMGLFIANASGYYESKIRERVIMTDKGIKEFESMVENGEEIDINSFLKDEREDYSSTFSKVGEGLTNNLETFITCMLFVFQQIKM